MKIFFGKYYFLFFFLTFLFNNNQINAQSCGFGCLGLSGFFGGYTFQYYDPQGLNEYIRILHSQYTPQIPEVKFDYGSGFRIGANFFRAQFDNYFLTAKGYYQFIKEEHSTTVVVQQGSLSNNFTLLYNHWGIGLDIGIPLFTVIDWKILEGGVTIYNTEFKQSSTLNDEVTGNDQYENDKTDIGYYIASGIIIHIVEDYISIEGSASYNNISINELKTADDKIIPGNNIDKNFIDSGGFAATIQLNVGVPL